MSYTPVAIFVYNRPLHTKATLEALSKNNLAKDTEIFIFSDNAKNDSDKTLVAQVREICKKINGFKNITLYNRETNFGLAENIISGISKIFETNETVICLEDDLVTSVGFLQYMNDALNFYQNKNIFSISGYMPPIILPQDYKYSTFSIMRNSSWGWGTWKEKWLTVDWNVSDFSNFIVKKQQRKFFEQSGNDVSSMLLKQQLGKIDSWSIRFNFASFKASEPTIYPTKSLIKNIGIDGSGTHMKKSEKYSTSITDKIDDSHFVPSEKIDTKIQATFKEFYNTSFIRRIINKLKLFYYITFKSKKPIK